VLRYYGGSHIKALRALYPELDLKQEKFSEYLGFLKRRKITDELARSKNFNPLDSEKWYTIRQKDIKGIVRFILSVCIILIDALHLGRWSSIASLLSILTYQNTSIIVS
jgi:hypothetical protein